MFNWNRVCEKCQFSAFGEQSKRMKWNGLFFLISFKLHHITWQAAFDWMNAAQCLSADEVAKTKKRDKMEWSFPFKRKQRTKSDREKYIHQNEMQIDSSLYFSIELFPSPPAKSNEEDVKTQFNLIVFLDRIAVTGRKNQNKICKNIFTEFVSILIKWKSQAHRIVRFASFSFVPVKYGIVQ